MSTPFICRQCIARLSQSSVKRFKPKPSRLHTQAVPASTPPLPSPPFTEGSNPPNAPLPVSEIRHSLHGQGDDVPSPAAVDVESQRPGDGISDPENESQWDGDLKRFVPRRRKSWEEIANAPTPAGSRDLKGKILEALGDYRIVHGDLVHMYGLSRSEARHAVGQLERLLWGRSLFDAAARLDDFHLWKRDFSRQLQTISQNTATSGLDGDRSEIGPWTSLAEEDFATIKAAWQRLDQNRREQLWPQMVFSAFTSNPGVLPTFIRATFDPSWSPSYLVEDMVYLLFRTLESLQPSERKERERQVAELVPYILDQCPSRYMAFDQLVLHRTILALNLDELANIYETLKKQEHIVHINTLQHIASRFAKSSAHKLDAAEIICSLADMPEFNINLPAPASICTSLLTLHECPPFPEGQAEPDKLFKLLLEHGLRPNLLSLTALMRNFCVRGRIDTAWKIFDLLLQHNFVPDPHVFSILLNGSKHSFDVPSVHKIIEMVFSRDAWTEVIVNDFIDLIFLQNEAQPEQRRRQRKSNNAWRPMLQLYAKFFDLRPLQKFFRFPLENVIAGRAVAPEHATPVTDLADALRPQPEHMLFKPTSHALLLLLTAHIRSLDDPRTVVYYYKNFTRLLHSGDPIAAQLIMDKGTMVYDVFLRALMQFRESIRAPMSIIYSMMTNAERERNLTGKNIYHPFPSVHTWTILLNGFKNHRHIQGALNVLNMMIQLGNVQPNLVTWNALIKAFTRVGDVQGAVRTMRLLEQAGFSSDEYTVEAFSALSRERRDQAIKLIEQSREVPVKPRDPAALFSGGRTPSSLLQRPRRSPDGSAHPAPSYGRPLGTPPAGPSLAQKLDEARKEWSRHAAELNQRGNP